MRQERDIGARVEEDQHMGEAHHRIEKGELPSSQAALFWIRDCGMHTMLK
jgi:hypothetical protein